MIPNISVIQVGANVRLTEDIYNNSAQYPIAKKGELLTVEKVHIRSLSVMSRDGQSFRELLGEVDS